MFCWCGQVLVSCGDDDGVLPVEEEPGSITDNEAQDGKDEAVSPVLDDESLKFVGVWKGPGPRNNSNDNVIEGTWVFRNDSSYSYSRPYYSESGKWRYNLENKC